MTKTTEYDVFGLGNAIVDAVTFVDEETLRKTGLSSGVMTLSESTQQVKLLSLLKNHTLQLRSGGSAGNSMWAIMQCGGKACYTAKVSKDSNGVFFQDEMTSHGIEFPVEPLSETEGSTGTCVVLTTPDAQRTMSTNLGVSVRLSASDIDTDRLKRASYVYCEGYLWTGESTRATCIEAMEQAKKAGVPLAFTYSDPFLVENYRDDFARVTKEYCDIVFCNRDEALSMISVAGGKGNHEQKDIQNSLNYLRERAQTVIVTNSEKGCYLCHDKINEQIEGFSAASVTDTNGAGDAFAGGVLFALSKGHDISYSARWGNYLGAQVIAIHGARLERSYLDDMRNI